METIIVICLLIIIALLLQDKIVIKKRMARKPPQKKNNPTFPDIMGQPNPMRSLYVPINTTKSHIQETEINPDNLDIKYDENENVSIQIRKEELDEVFSNIPNFEEEEEEWNNYGISSANDGFAQGVTFEELSSVGMLLQKEKLEPSQKETAVGIVQKIQGTELFSLLENSMESASRKIAELLDGSLSFETNSGSSILRKNDLNDFDIGDFV
ncbi:conjugal transfer protein TraD [Flavobacterium sp. IB48]|uniref:conjugal transfer protein TraD n=1 Tax=Flavobacterium sp. IB48 TaxID=2779375 RepID=UPI0018E9089E|nr:conjugal transfer protein TraD [Flavobacterium sp. IB48]MBJ2126335.1 conjugal transfer protein TraD [Flavobacterium sp. IB48]